MPAAHSSTPTQSIDAPRTTALWSRITGPRKMVYGHPCKNNCGTIRLCKEKHAIARPCLACHKKNRRENPKRAEVQCKGCGTLYRAVWRSTQEPMFCTLDCLNKWQKEQGDAIRVRVICKHCKREFKIKPCAAKSGNIECCSNACKLAHHKWQECPTCHKTFNARHNKDRIYCSKSCYLKSWKETRIERVVRTTLEQVGLYAIREYQVKGMHSFDFYVPSLNLLIEADGDYWHNRPWSKERDARKTQKAIDRGFNVERFWETAIMSDSWPDVFETAIRKYIPGFEFPKQPTLFGLR